MNAELGVSQYAIGRAMGKPRLSLSGGIWTARDARPNEEVVKFSLTVREDVCLLRIGQRRILVVARSINGKCTHAQHQSRSDYALRSRAFGRHGNGRFRAHLAVCNGGVTCAPRDGRQRRGIGSKMPAPLGPIGAQG
jgi:hypothetical protein